MRHFFTGATGFLGRNFLRSMIQLNKDDEFYLLVRNINSVRNLQNIVEWPDSERIHYVFGDITLPDFGIKREVLNIIKKCDTIFHFAAATSFDVKHKKNIFRINIDGTKNLIALAQKFCNLTRLYYVSTAYVAGLNKNIIYEDEMCPEVGFRNIYEESKYKAEIIVRETSLPWIIFRPSIIVGDSKKFDAQGETRMIYGFILGIYYSLSKVYGRHFFIEKWMKKIPIDEKISIVGNTRVRKNFICIDQVVDTMLYITNNSRDIFRTYHIVNNKYLTLQDIAIATAKAMCIKEIVLCDEIINPNTIERRINKLTKVFTPYCINDDPIWDTSNVDKIIKNNIRINMTSKLFTKLVQEFIRKEIILKNYIPFIDKKCINDTLKLSLTV